MPQCARAVRARRHRLHKREATRWAKVLRVEKALDPRIEFIHLLASPSEAEAQKWQDQIAKALQVPKEYLTGGHSSAGSLAALFHADRRFEEERLRLKHHMQSLFSHVAKKRGVSPSSYPLVRVSPVKLS